MHATLLWLSLLAGSGAYDQDAAAMAARIEAAMFGDHRSETNRARNRYRHPVGTLMFFGIAPGMRVIEIWPGGGWYTEVLSPVMRDIGTFVAAGYDPEVEGQPEYRYRLYDELKEKFAASPEIYDQVAYQPFSPPESASLGEPASADMVLTFRNTHGWINDGIVDQVFAEFFKVLKPGGTLGVVQHRTDAGPAEQTARKGYVSEAAMIRIAEKAGFELVDRSEINANPADSHDHPEGVWTLPPTLRLGDTDRDKYLAIGESDRMTLRFVKPAQ